MPENVKRYVDKEEKQVGQREAGIIFAVIIITSQRTAKEIIIYLRRGEHLAKNRLVLLLAWLCLRDITLTNMHLCIYATHISNRLIPFLPPGSPKVVVRKR